MDSKPSLADKLKSLGVKKGIPPLSQRKPGSPTIDVVVRGSFLPTPRGEVFVAEQNFPQDYHYGNSALLSSFPLSLVSQWAGDSLLSTLSLSKFAFLDTETSGLSGGTGTCAFLVGVARFVDDQFVLKQFFMRDPAEEAALLDGLAEFLAPCEALVSFNGKAFDAPLLRTRYKIHDTPCPFDGYSHLDLLPLARRLWRDRLESRALKFLEEHVLEFKRSSDETPGYEIPWLYFDYLRTGDASPLAGVFYHNAMDVTAMAALLAHMNDMLENPYDGAVQHGLDFVALGKLFEDLGHAEEAAKLFERGLESPMGEADFHVAVKRLSILQKKRGGYEEAVRLWKKAAKAGHIYAHIELAKYYEHKMRDVKAALKWTESARKQTERADLPAYERKHWLEEIAHRLARLERKDGL
ncbi:MAG TPA: ribonuclease H-like domain-containing protein [Anaerolineales bacterium]|nr:ribonuclease H-like domain-containing protein [Anaerolineales bacterium]HMR97623.1 ribonuclease H-like domain-containing protein [Anaerolineales bacterium]HNQ93041.1 ribonuclease H-like domain-containing protein [Anaerolineales bacterium]HNS61354.1 ribonuclease H-like domain-containing protein [Anaerolineales bacterium]